jgi:hypothetical protein
MDNLKTAKELRKCCKQEEIGGRRSRNWKLKLLGFMPIKPDVGRTKRIPACYFLHLCHSDFLDFSRLVL